LGYFLINPVPVSGLVNYILLSLALLRKAGYIALWVWKWVSGGSGNPFWYKKIGTKAKRRHDGINPFFLDLYRDLQKKNKKKD
jgi:hypothetical protein